VSSPGPLKDEETTLPAADGSKSVTLNTSSDSGQKVPITSPTSSVSQSPNSQNIFSFSSQQKPPAFSGMTTCIGFCLLWIFSQTLIMYS
jgi:hypothetical protein